LPSFAQLSELMSESEQLDPDNSAAVTLVKQDPAFFDHLAQLSRDVPEKLADLLGVDTKVVASWQAKIRSTMKDADRIKAEKQQEKIVRTGG